MTASTTAIADLLTMCEQAADDELAALGRALNSIEWTATTAPGAPLFVALARVPLAVAVERAEPDADMARVRAIEAGVEGG